MKLPNLVYLYYTIPRTHTNGFTVKKGGKLSLLHSSILNFDRSHVFRNIEGLNEASQNIKIIVCMCMCVMI